MKRVLAIILGVIAGLILLTVLAVTFAQDEAAQLRLHAARQITPEAYEREARQLFERRYPGEKPLNWRIAETAERFFHEQPMGRFVLHENDCSDFVGCVIDEALGTGARFNRAGSDHLLCGEGGSLDRTLFVSWRLPDAGPVQAGDVIGVRHSPWYPPQEESIGHVGVVGPDGRVLDFTKLRSWSVARYNQVEFDFFIRHNQPNQVIVSRLRPQFRYRVLEIG
ncbi:MAG: CHAP domain-containing protein [candidate division WS1 bacterium]|jgi:hypothetical protein|nr:CHAP domain-containing protein [candidate division WS1 bacterium]